MDFSEKEIERLYDAFFNSEKLKVYGSNGMGHKFAMEGYIAAVKRDEIPALSGEDDEYFPGVFDNCIIFDTGKLSGYPKTYFRTPFSAMLLTDYNELDLPVQPMLFIESIRSLTNHETIYSNDEFADMAEYFKYVNSAFEKDRLKYGRVPASIDSKGVFFNDNIGKPICINGAQGLLSCATDILPNGNMCLMYMSGPNLHNTFLQSDKVPKLKDGLICDLSKSEEENAGLAL